jgi:hypothetical protein
MARGPALPRNALAYFLTGEAPVLFHVHPHFLFVCSCVKYLPELRINPLFFLYSSLRHVWVNRGDDLIPQHRYE